MAQDFDLLRNRDPHTSLGPFDGKVAAFAQLGLQHYFITTHADYVPALPSLEIPHALFMRTDMRYGTDDPTLWPQQYTSFYCHMPLIPKKGSRPELDVMWWNPSPADFVLGSAALRGLGRLKHTPFSRLLPPINQLVDRCRVMRSTSPALALPLFGQLTQHILALLEQLQTLPTTFTKMVFRVASVQRAFLELDALYQYMTVYKERMENYNATRADGLAQCVGSFTTQPTVAQQFWAAGVPCWFLRPVEVFDAENILKVVALEQPDFGLPDPNAHGDGTAPVLYSGNSTFAKIKAIQDAAIQHPWYSDPFETTVASLVPAGRAIASASHSVVQIASTSSVAQPFLTSTSPATRTHPSPQNHQSQPRSQPRYKPYPAKDLAKPTAPAKINRDKFSVLDSPGMPPSIACMADALAQVNRSVSPYTTNPADKRYVLPEPALFVNSQPLRCYKFLHHWNLLVDGFIYLLSQHPEPHLFAPQEWRDVLEGLMTTRGAAGSRAYRRSQNLEDHLRPVLQACNITSLEGFPAPPETVPTFSITQMQEIVWNVAETSFRFEFRALDKRASKQDRLAEVKNCFAGHMLVGTPLEFSKLGWAAPTVEERHRYVSRTATLMLDWTTQSPRPNIIRHVSEHRSWSPGDMQILETAVCCYYTQAFWEYFGRAAVVPLRLNHDVQKEDGEL